MRTSKTNTDGRREDLRLLAGPFARAVEQLRTATEPAAAERVVPIGPHQVNRRLQVLAAMLGLEGVFVALRTPGSGLRSSSAAARRPPPCRPPAAGAARRWSPATPRPSPSPGSSGDVEWAVNGAPPGAVRGAGGHRPLGGYLHP